MKAGGKNHMKQALIFFLFFSLFLLSAGCISGEIRHDIQADGSDRVEVEIDKTGVMEEMDCESFIEALQSNESGALSEEDLENIKNTDCEDTPDSMILSTNVPLESEASSIRIVKRNDKEYLRFEEESNPLFDIRVRLPARVTSTNGKIGDDDRSVTFKKTGITLDAPETIYAECEKPGLCALPMIMLAGLLFASFLQTRK